MEHETDNVILFPKWRSALEEESLQALKEKRYDEALVKLDKLLSYHIDDHEIITGKLICLMELGYYEEAQDICEELIQSKNQNYYHYVHMYLTILFQTNQFEQLMKQVEYEIENNAIPLPVKEQFKQLYDMSEKMNYDLIAEKSTTYLDELFQAISSQHFQEQWLITENLRKMNAEPNEEVIALLTSEDVHPVTKTSIFQWLQDKNYSKAVTVHKLDLHVSVKPDDIAKLQSQPFIKETLLMISGQEQKNPTLYQLLEVLLFRYIYVRFPIMPPSEDVKQIAAALSYIGETYLNLHTISEDEINKDYIEEIKLCETLYLSIIEE
ncbi:hypothetical protein CIL03_01280 [Virgibacillus indicus]|uniref:Tetratricopeptide repeat-containing protein n=1 Tax=Virgibacillus indicus TaxID=2024554 RepID=A0A265NEC0_9BACI|nr:DUF3196 family protein [Virgibacillus indicus]OZU89799.1 hypothetical protein CIL03_01280 [Virgibacillus indicus]